MNIGILGLGTVGCGVVNVLQKNKDEIFSRSAQTINIIQAAVKSLDEKKICSTAEFDLTTDAFQVVNNPDVEIVLELIGGTTIAKELVETALKNGKHVITANKALIATNGNELLNLANDNNASLLFEAAVAGGVPIIKALEQGLSANKIDLIAGIINGTGNFILTKMKDEGASFEDVLAQAQKLGYAEADPTFDIEGIDAAHKLTILSAIAFGSKLQFDKVSTKGIGQVEGEDVSFADELGYKIKHLGIAKKIDNQIQMRVHPALVPKEHLLANVNGVMNAVLIKGNAVGETLYYGAGAGSEATASAVIADLIDIIKGTTDKNILGWSGFKDFDNQKKDTIESIFYLRLLATDEAGVLAKITAIFAEHNISIEKVVQKRIDRKNNAHIAIITNKVKTSEVNNAVREISKNNFIQDEIKIIYVEELN